MTATLDNLLSSQDKIGDRVDELLREAAQRQEIAAQVQVEAAQTMLRAANVLAGAAGSQFEFDEVQ